MLLSMYNKVQLFQTSDTMHAVVGTAVKEGGQGRYCTEFGAGSGVQVQVASLGSSPTPTNLPAPRAIFSIFLNYFHIFCVIIFFLFSR